MTKVLASNTTDTTQPRREHLSPSCGSPCRRRPLVAHATVPHRPRPCSTRALHTGFIPARKAWPRERRQQRARPPSATTAARSATAATAPDQQCQRSTPRHDAHHDGTRVVMKGGVGGTQIRRREWEIQPRAVRIRLPMAESSLAAAEPTTSKWGFSGRLGLSGEEER